MVGKLAVLEGDPGLGKSTVTLDLAARVSTGSPMPGEVEDRCRGGVLLLSAEDDPADTIRPRLEAAGADLDRVVTITGIPEGGAERPVKLPTDLERVEEVIIDHDVVLVIIDPLVAFLGSVNVLSDQKVRAVLHALASLAERTRCSIVAVRHLTKARSGQALHRGGGSIAIIAAARTGLLVAPDALDPSRQVLTVIKSNLGPVPAGLAYRLAPHDSGVATVAWEGEVDVTPNDRLALMTATPKLDAAEDVLTELLLDGPRPRREIEAATRAQGIGWRTVETAKANLGVTDHQVPTPGRRGPGPSFWALP